MSYPKHEKEKDFKEAFFDLKELFDTNNIPFFLIQGTLLGYFREKQFIKGDDDIDTGIFYRDLKNLKDNNGNTLSLKNIIKNSKNFRIVMELGTLDNGYEFLLYHKSGVAVGCSVLYEISKNYYWKALRFGICRKKKEGYCKCGQHIDGLKEVEFYGKKVKVPTPIKGICIEWYGKDFMTSKKKGRYQTALKNGFYKNIIN